MNNILNTPYDREKWISFLKNKFLPEDFVLKREKFAIDFKSKYIKPQAYWIGDCSSLDDLAVIELEHESENDPRISVSRDAFKLMAEHQLSKALFFFKSKVSNNFRFSLITLDLSLKGDKEEYSYSNPKRYSFFLGKEAKDHTPNEFLIQKGRIKDLDDLQQRFSIEVVNKEFYSAIQLLFYKLVGGKVRQGSKNVELEPMLKLPATANHKINQEFSVRLIGRLVFCWFLKKKKSDKGIPLIPADILSSGAIKENYYHNIIEPLFFNLLNTPIKERKQEFRSTLYDMIPFLNGGLFDPNLHQDYYDLGPDGKSYHLNTLVIPDIWLKEFVSLLETYNFTIDENTSIDIELSVDPEMLGRIFENLLAEINPETDKTAKKSTGSYYTPRAIVEYMVDESLSEFFLSRTNISETKIRDLLDYTIEEVELTDSERLSLFGAIDGLKVLDPACGSGAFPMGVLQKLILVLQKIDPDSIEWVIRQLAQISDELTKKALDEKYMNENWRYKHKMGVIRKSIFGVDIQSIATEISKLRLFLTLIVDENIIDTKPNRNINPLPNLSFKFVTANSLIGSSEDEVILKKYTKFKTQFKDIMRRYFEASAPLQKRKIEIEFKSLQDKLLEQYFEPDVYEIDIFNNKTKTTKKKNNSFIEKLLSWNPFIDEPTGWFDPKWMFGEEQGFDIIIGNPPYGAKISDIEKNHIKKRLKDTSNPNSASYFIDISKNEFLADKGILTMIVPKSMLYSASWFSLVKALLPKITSVLDVEKGFEDVLLEQVAFTYSSSTTSHYKAFKFDVKEIYQKCVINKKLVDKLEALICDVNKLEIDVFLNRIIKLDRLNTISKTTRGVPFQKFLDETGDFKVIGGKDIQKFNINSTKGYLSKEIIDSNKKVKSLLLPKIVSQRLVAHVQFPYPHMKIIATIDLHGDVLGVDTVENTFITDNKYSYKYLVAIINSKFISWHLYKFVFCSAIRTVDLDDYYIGKLPIILYDKQTVFEDIVDLILQKKTEVKDTQTEENLIDLMVYKLYALTYAEVKIVDPEIDSVLAEFGLSAEQYESMSVEDLGNLQYS
ncbi:MAG: TaqI-like C-terminal specificity domain-containing protein [Candidatus Cloacimonadales bacterium]